MLNYPYLLELRIGHARDRVGGPVEEVKSVFRLGAESPTVPHMTLYGPFRMNPGYHLRELKHAIEPAVKGYDELPYRINGWDCRTGKNGGVIAYNIEISGEMKACYHALRDSLRDLTVPKYPWDNSPEEMWFHITFAYHLKERKFREIKRYLRIEDGPQGNFIERLVDRLCSGNIFKRIRSTPENPLILPHNGLRITILHHRIIAAEYDLVMKRWLSRTDAKSVRLWGRTLQGYRRNSGIQITNPNFRNERQTTFVIGDLHLGHSEIIKYCCRPFLSSNVKEMDSTLINNWNFTVKPNDTVIFLGDLSYRSGRHPQYYLSQLQGKKIFINGNQDKGINFGTSTFSYIFSGIDLFFTHDPTDTHEIPEGFSGWIVHGHVHNNDLDNFPFFDPENKRINVSAETVHYQPVSLLEICRLIKTRNQRLLIYHPFEITGRNRPEF